jgi:hypothetical protein
MDGIGSASPKKYGIVKCDVLIAINGVMPKTV